MPIDIPSVINILVASVTLEIFFMWKRMICQVNGFYFSTIECHPLSPWICAFTWRIKKNSQYWLLSWRTVPRLVHIFRIMSYTQILYIRHSQWMLSLFESNNIEYFFSPPILHPIVVMLVDIDMAFEYAPRWNTLAIFLSLSIKILVETKLEQCRRSHLCLRSHVVCKMC